jgi:hypothetical protein
VLPYIFLLILGLIIEAISSDVILHKSLLLAESWGVEQSFIGAMISDIHQEQSIPFFDIPVLFLFQ